MGRRFEKDHNAPFVRNSEKFICKHSSYITISTKLNKNKVASKKYRKQVGTPDGTFFSPRLQEYS